MQQKKKSIYVGPMSTAVSCQEQTSLVAKKTIDVIADMRHKRSHFVVISLTSFY
jgi:hypothetical protein